MSLRGFILLFALIAIFAMQTYASGVKLKPLGLYHWGGVAVALSALWILASL
jgi:hypothetical protein